MQLTDPDQLDRIGIIAHVFAAFLLAPELLGVRNIQRLETSSQTLTLLAGRMQERAFKWFPEFVTEPIGRKVWSDLARGIVLSSMFAYSLKSRSLDHTLLSTAILILVVVLAILLILWPSIGSAYYQGVLMISKLLILGPLVGLASLFFSLSLLRNGWIGLYFLICLLLFVSFGHFPASSLMRALQFAPYLIFAGIVFFPGIAVALIFLSSLRTISVLLSASYRLVELSQGRAKGILMGLGVLFFLFGSVVQFWATF